ncbi:MAG: hypothetical protein FJ279_25420 [Planctomycetes bacterium]|nr:hypothetical protein [Planctomycetota bacterium]
MAIEIAKPSVLVVEGREEELFFGALLDYMELLNVQIAPIGGKRRLRENLKALVSQRTFADVVSLGVVRDANSDPKAAFQSVRDALREAGLPAPERPLLPTGRSPRVAVLILPEASAPGTLEDLCLRAVARDPAMLCVEQYILCLEKERLALPANMSKAKVQTFLASRREAGKRLGEAAQAGYWPWGHAAFDQVRDFLRQIG